jgi:hypothetical protein
MNAYQVTGLTKVVTATSSSSSVNFTPAEVNASFSGQSGPVYVKITNGSSADNIYFKTGLTAQTAIIPVNGTPGSTCIPAYAEVIVQVAAGDGLSPATVYVACIATTSSPVYITPVTLVG